MKNSIAILFAVLFVAACGGKVTVNNFYGYGGNATGGMTARDGTGGRAISPVRRDPASETGGSAGDSSIAQAGSPSSTPSAGAAGEEIGGEGGFDEDAAETGGAAGLAQDAGLLVELAVRNMPGRTILPDEFNVHMACWSFTTSEQAADVSSICLDHVGAGTVSDIESVSLFGDAIPITLPEVFERSLDADGRICFDFGMIEGVRLFRDGALQIPPESYTVMCVTANFSAHAPGGEHAFRLSSAHDIGVGEGVAVIGSFPQTGNTFTIANPSSGDGGAGGAGGTDGQGGAPSEGGSLAVGGVGGSDDGTSGEAGSGDAHALPLEIDLASDTPETMIATPSVNYHFTKYVVTNPNDTHVSIDTFDVDEVSPDGKIADFASVYVRVLQDGEWFWSITLTAYPIDDYDLTQHFTQAPLSFSNANFEVPANGQIDLEILGLMSVPHAPRTAESACDGAPCSGDMPALKLMNVADSNGVEAVIHAHDPQPMVLRKARPRFLDLPLDDNTVRDGVTAQLAQFNARTYYSDFAAMKAITFNVDLQGVSLQGFEFHRNGAKLEDVLLYAGTSVAPVDLLQDALTESSDVTVIFEHEEVLTESNTVYALVATPARLQPGALVTTAWSPRSLGEPSVTGWFTGLFGSYVWVQDSSGAYWTNLLWSDLSSVPHSDNPDSVTGTSNDWMTDWGIEYDLGPWHLSVY
jgi:hypothetical protein